MALPSAVPAVAVVVAAEEVAAVEEAAVGTGALRTLSIHTPSERHPQRGETGRRGQRGGHRSSGRCQMYFHFFNSLLKHQ